jgi:hypothetical protein
MKFGHNARPIVTCRPAVFSVLVAVLISAAPLVASAQTPSLNWGSEVNPSRCPNDQGYRYLEINVTRHVEGDLALTNAVATSGAAWAVRDFNQHIQVWRIGIIVQPPPIGGERFCALVRYQGSFTTLGNGSPGGTDSNLAPGIDGSSKADIGSSSTPMRLPTQYSPPVARSERFLVLSISSTG